MGRCGFFLERIVRVAGIGVQSFVQNAAHTTAPNGSCVTLATVAVLRLDIPAALGLALRFAKEADETVFSPTGVPGVTNDPVISIEAGIGSVSCKHNSVILRDVFGVIATVEDARFVVGPVGGVGGHGEGASEGKGIHDGASIVGLDGGVTGSVDLGIVLKRVRVTLEVFAEVGDVGVSPFLVQTGDGGDGVDGEFSDATVATSRTTAIVGVDSAGGDLLLGENVEFI